MRLNGYGKRTGVSAVAAASASAAGDNARPGVVAADAAVSRLDPGGGAAQATTFPSEP
jgi:hypothetical protein